MNMKAELRPAPETDIETLNVYISFDELEFIPEKNGEICFDASTQLVKADFARKLERERDELREKIIRIKKSHEETEREEIESMREAIKETCIVFKTLSEDQYAPAYYQNVCDNAITKLQPFLP